MGLSNSSGWIDSDSRKNLFKAAEEAGKIFEREIREETEHELRDAARAISSSRH